MSDAPLPYTATEIDQLALDGCETVVAEPGVTCAYDVEGYERIHRRQIRDGHHRYYDPPLARRRRRQVSAEHLDARGYLMRVGGFRRELFLGPDQAASMFQTAGIQYADSLGNGLFEHLVLCRKYGIV